MRIGVPRESLAGEKRVAASPKSVQALIKMGFEVVIESQAGQHANFLDSAYEAAGASIADSATTWQADLIFRVNAPQETELDNMKSGASIVSFVAPAQNPELLERPRLLALIC